MQIGAPPNCERRAGQQKNLFSLPLCRLTNKKWLIKGK